MAETEITEIEIAELRKLFENRSLNPNAIRNTLVANPAVRSRLEALFEREKEKYCSLNKMVIALVTGMEFGRCAACGKELTYDQTFAHAKFCSNKCKLSGGFNPFAREDVKEKIRRTNTERYGADNPMRSDVLRGRHAASVERRYGVANPFQAREVKERIAETNTGRYGAASVSSVPAIMEKARRERLKNAYDNIKEKYAGVYEPMFSAEEYRGVDNVYEWRCCRCGNVFSARYDDGMVLSRCFVCEPRKQIADSLFEQEVAAYVESLGYAVKRHDKSILWPRELDIVVEEKKVAVECDGIFWHGVRFRPDPSYHAGKRLAAMEKGYRLAHVWEDEWTASGDAARAALKSFIDGTPSPGDGALLPLDMRLPAPRDGYSMSTLPPALVRREKDGASYYAWNCGYAEYTPEDLYVEPRPDEVVEWRPSPAVFPPASLGEWKDRVRAYRGMIRGMLKELGLLGMVSEGVYVDGVRLDFALPEYRLGLKLEDAASRNSTRSYWGLPHIAASEPFNEWKRTTAAGWRVVRFYETEMLDPAKWRVLRNMVAYRCGMCRRVGARETRLRILPALETKKLFEANNIQGYRAASTAFLLEDRRTGDPLMCYTVGRAFFGKGAYDAEIARGCCLTDDGTGLGVHVPGGASKLWKAVLEYYGDRGVDGKPGRVDSIVYYTDSRYYDGASISHLMDSGGLPGRVETLRAERGFMNYWRDLGVAKNREPGRNDEIRRLAAEGRIDVLPTPGAVVHCYFRG